MHLASILQLGDGAFIVGGQALNIWAERYSGAAELGQYGPYTSKDIDYFGHREAAQKLADALGGRVLTPTVDDATPQSAKVEAVVAGEKIEIDFLIHVKGVNADVMKRSAVELILTVRTDAGEGVLTVPIMHPLHVMQSRIANVLELGRKSDLACRQLNASPIVVREYVRQMLEIGKHREATATLEQHICGRIQTDDAHTRSCRLFGVSCGLSHNQSWCGAAQLGCAAVRLSGSTLAATGHVKLPGAPSGPGRG